MDEIKLVIWDMDDTFWHGNIQNGTMKMNQDHINIIRKLVGRGIMNSISSKNFYGDVKKALEDAHIFELFIFPAINFEGKGLQVKHIIENCKLLPENVLFLDDNEVNCNEVRYYNPHIHVLKDITDFYALLKTDVMKGKNDENYNRLKQYKLMEKRTGDVAQFDSNEDFLYQSEISVSLHFDCTSVIDRIAELIHRTHQLNYTKRKETMDSLKSLINDKLIECGYVTCRDRYGDYGIVGFYALNPERKLIHYLFSCRVLGLCIEQYVYICKLDCPDIDVQGEVASRLDKKTIPKWINQPLKNTRFFHQEQHESIQKSILVRAGCDFQQMRVYLDDILPNISYEFNQFNYHRDHSYLVAGCQRYSDDEKKILIKECPFLSSNTFETDMFSGKHSVVVYSVLMDYAQAVYRKNGTCLFVSYGGFDKPFLFEGHNIGAGTVEEIKKEYQYQGGVTEEEFYKNLLYIREKIPSNTKLIIINGCEVNVLSDDEKDWYKRHVRMNAIVDSFVQENDNVYLLDVREFVQKEDDLLDCIRHYKRYVYYQLSMELVKMINEISC